MANEEQLDLLRKGVKAWNAWHEQKSNELNKYPRNEWHELVEVKIDLRDADLSGLDLSGVMLPEADLMGANLCGTDLSNALLGKAQLAGANLGKANLRDAVLVMSTLNVANLSQADLRGADLRNADLRFANLAGANLSGAALDCADLGSTKITGATLTGASLSETNLMKADLSGSDLRGADLSKSVLVQAKLEKAQLEGCRVYGCAAWDLEGTPESQKDLIISQKGDGDITVDDLEIAQFIYLMYDNKKIRNVIDSITAKGVLILGRFTPPERKAVLDGLRMRLREFNLLPIVFDFDRPTDKDYTETVQTLAGMSLFVIVDVTNPRSTPMEMEATVKQFKIPYLPIIDTSADKYPFAMMVDLQKSFHWVLPTLEYDSKERLLDNIRVLIIDRALAKHNELRLQKANEPKAVTVDDLLKGGGR